MTVSLMKISFTHLTLTDAVAAITERIAQKRYDRPLTVFTPNTEQLMQARSDAAFLQVLQASDVRVPDAVGLTKADWWRAFTTGRPWLMRERVAGVDLAEALLFRASQQGWKVVLIGGMNNMATTAADNLKKRLHGLDVVGLEAGVIGYRGQGIGDRGQGLEESEESQKAIQEIQKLKPDIVLVGLGAPKQELWTMKHKDTLPIQVMMVVGGAIDVWAGKVQRAPQWMRSMGLEWLWRLMQEPWRFSRQLRLIKFMWLVLWGKW